MLASHLEPLDGLLTGRAEDAVVQVADGAGSAGEGRQRGRGAHPCHCIGHCREITPLIDSLAIIDKVFVIAQVCQRERRGSEDDRQTDRRADGRKGADAGWFRKDGTNKKEQAEERKTRRKRNGRGRRGQQGGVKSSNDGWKKQSSFLLTEAIAHREKPVQTRAQKKTKARLASTPTTSTQARQRRGGSGGIKGKNRMKDSAALVCSMSLRPQHGAGDAGVTAVEPTHGEPGCSCATQNGFLLVSPSIQDQLMS